MKKHSLLLLAGASFLGTALSLLAQNNNAATDPFVKNPGDAAAAGKPGAAPWQNCMLVLEAYALDKNDALALLESERGSAARYRRVTDLAKTGKARLEILTALTTKSGQRAVSEAIDEVRYATEFARPVAKGGIAPPTAYETRHVGDMLEFEPVLGPDGGQTCGLDFVPQHIDLLGFRDIGAMADDSPISQPLFSSQKTVTSTRLPANEPHFLGSLSPTPERGAANGGADSEMWLAFVRMNVVGPTAEEMKPPADSMDWMPLNFEYRIYSLDRAAAREILVAPLGLQAPWISLQALLAEKKARFEHLVSVQTNSGQRAVTEEVREVRYATEYAPAARPTFEEKTNHTSTTRPGILDIQKMTPSEREKIATTTETTTVNRLIANTEANPGSPSGLDTRQAGVTVEVEPVVRPDLAIDLNHVLNRVTHLGDLKVTGLAARYPAQPLFETRRVTTSQTVLFGRQMLIGTFNPPGANGVNDRTDSGRTWLLFVRATRSEP